MPDAKPRFWVAPVGADPNDKSAWTELPVGGGDYTPAFIASDSSVMTIQARVNKIASELASDYYGGFPQRWMAGTPPPGSYEIKTASQEALDLYFGKTTCNERSKPMGLKEAVRYEDAGGRKLIVGQSPNGHVAETWIRTPDSCGAYVKDADIIPVALNVLGYDRPGLLGGFETTIGGSTNHGVVIKSDEHRSRTLATAIAYLKSVDRYDQRVVEREAEEAAHAAKLAARDAARDRLHEAASNLGAVGIYSSSLGVLKEATEAYEAAQAAISPVPYPAF